MAPTVCETEFPMAGTTINTYVYRRRRPQNGIKQRSFAREQMLLFRTRTINETPLTSRENSLQKLESTSTIPNCPVPEGSNKLSTNTDEDYERYVVAKKDLLSIVIRTIILVQRNRILQKRVNALRAETRRFFHSVLNNSENQCQQQETQAPSHSEDEIVSSYTEKIVSTSSPSFSPDSTGSFFHEVTSTCDNCNHTNDESSSSDKSEISSKSEC